MAVFRIDRFAPSSAAASAARDRLSAMLKRRVGARGKPGASVLRAIESLLVIAIGALLVWTIWTGAGPIDPPPPPPARLAPVEDVAAGPINPFRTAEVAEAAPADPGAAFAETTLDLKLHGTWIDEAGGVAFIGTSDGKQARYAPGDAITGGVALDSVYRDRVVISRNGVRESLSLINRDQAIGAGADYAATRAAEGDADVDGMAAIGNLILVTPEADEVGNTRLILQAGQDAKGFAALGLQPGDTLVAVDNQAIDRDIAGALETIAAIEGQPEVTLSIERDGVVLPITVALTPASANPNEQE